MSEPISSDEAIEINNKLEFGDFLAGKTLEEFMQWVYKEYGVSAEEQAEIERSINEEEPCLVIIRIGR